MTYTTEQMMCKIGNVLITEMRRLMPEETNTELLDYLNEELERLWSKELMKSYEVSDND